MHSVLSCVHLVAKHNKHFLNNEYTNAHNNEHKWYTQIYTNNECKTQNNEETLFKTSNATGI